MPIREETRVVWWNMATNRTKGGETGVMSAAFAPTPDRLSSSDLHLLAQVDTFLSKLGCERRVGIPVPVRESTT